MGNFQDYIIRGRQTVNLMWLGDNNQAILIWVRSTWCVW